ncbi:MAG TPA: hypothetical protein DCE39_19845, partial [Planctomycetaceae bacterium]|nr:hypothetical protein [Planctomycetaceae bacterium]
MHQDGGTRRWVGVLPASDGAGHAKERSMAEITIQILEGLERGRVFESLETPVTIGREDDNSI